MPPESKTFKFLQLSDVHLDSPQNHGVLAYSAAQRAARYADLVESIATAFRLAKEHKVDAVLIPGALWEQRTIRGDTAGTVLEAIEELGEIPVVIAPGDSDPFVLDSPYSDEFLAARGMRGWPANALIFTSPDFETLKHPTRDDVSFTGRSFTSTDKITDRLLEQPINKGEETPFNILLFHGSLESHAGSDGQHRITAPFSTEELQAQKFTYAALGHYHEYIDVKDEAGKTIGAYSGCLVGRNFEELGMRVVILGTITIDENGDVQTVLEPVEVASNRLTYLAVDVSGLDEDALREEVAYGIEDHGIRPDQDIVCISLEGSCQDAFNPVRVLEDMRSDFYHLIIVDRTRPDYLSEEYDARTTEHKFIETMIERKQSAQANGDEETGAISGKTAEDALYYGLDALKRKKVTVRHVD
jgi:DNA repair exonuclease